jgi:Ribbon-helix-helix protein, copG family
VVKLSVSLSDDDVAVLDKYVEQAGLPSRSAGLQRAIRMLRHPTLEDDYADAWSDFAAAGEAEVWEATVGDGLGNAAR